jgi:Fe-S-cluster containining protein
LTFADVRRIHKISPLDRLRFREICIIYELPTAGGDQLGAKIIGRHYPVLMMEEDGIQWQGYLGLRFRFKKDVEENRLCPLLDPDGVTCGIHAEKPISCRAYPHTLEDNDTIAWNGGRCPHPWKYSPDELGSIIQEFRLFYDEMKEFFCEAQRWNELNAPHSVDRLVDFILSGKL